MDQLMVDVRQADVAVGDEAVLIGEQGGERIGVAEWADRLGTIGYEIVCGIGTRIPRLEIGDVPRGRAADRRVVARSDDRAAQDQPERGDNAIKTPGTSPSS